MPHEKAELEIPGLQRLPGTRLSLRGASRILCHGLRPGEERAGWRGEGMQGSGALSENRSDLRFISRFQGLCGCSSAVCSSWPLADFTKTAFLFTDRCFVTFIWGD